MTKPRSKKLAKRAADSAPADIADRVADYLARVGRWLRAFPIPGRADRPTIPVHSHRAPAKAAPRRDWQ
jgi:hypothetical protein